MIEHMAERICKHCGETIYNLRSCFPIGSGWKDSWEHLSMVMAGGGVRYRKRCLAETEAEPQEEVKDDNA